MFGLPCLPRQTLPNCNWQRGEQTYGREISPLSCGLGEGIVGAELPGFLRSEKVQGTEERGKDVSEDGEDQSHRRRTCNGRKLVCSPQFSKLFWIPDYKQKQIKP